MDQTDQKPSNVSVELQSLQEIHLNFITLIHFSPKLVPSWIQPPSKKSVLPRKERFRKPLEDVEQIERLLSWTP